jgi:carboxylesterase
VCSDPSQPPSTPAPPPDEAALLDDLIDTDDAGDRPDDPYYMEGSEEHACLLVHGSTGTAGDLRGLADHLHGRGFTVRGVSLPGHARRPARLAGIGWQDCYGVVHDAWRELVARYRHVHVIGFSFGGSLSIHLAANEPVEDLVLLAPGLHVNISARDVVGASLGLVPGTWMHTRLRWNLKLLAFFRIIAGELERVTCPVLIMHARDDPLVKVQSSIDVDAGIGSTQKRLIILEEGGHLLPWGPAHRQVWREVVAHLEARR